MPGNPSLAEDIANQYESSLSSQCYRVWMLQAYLNFKLPAHPCRRWRQIHPFHAHPVGSRNIFCDTSTGSLRPLVPLQLRATAQYFSPWCQSLQEIDLIKICLARNVQRCRFMGKILYSVPKIHIPQFPLFQFHPGDFLTFMWILLVLCPLVKAILIFSPWLTEPRDGRRSFLCPPSPMNPVFMLSSQPGYQDLEFLQFSHWTEVASSRLLFGLEFALFWEFQPPIQPPSILKVTEWLKGSIGVPGQAIRFRLVFSSSSSSLGIVSYSEGWYWPLSLRGCLRFSFNLTWRTCGCSWTTSWCLSQES